MHYSFGDFVLDAETGELRRSGDVVALRRQTFRLLQLLIERAPALLSRDTLLDEVWGRTALAPNAVPQAISELRRALGDDAQSPQYIETRHRRGYRFLAKVQLHSGPRIEVATADFAQPVEEFVPPGSIARARRHSLVAWALLACAAFIAAWGVPHFFPKSDVSTTTTSLPRASALVLGALPVDPDVPPWIAPTALELFAQHLADSRLRLLRSDALGLADSTQDVRWQHQAHDLLGADHAIGGRWRIAGDGHLILDLSVVDLADGQVIASRRIEGAQENLDELVAEAGSVIAAALRIPPLDDREGKSVIRAQDGADLWSGLKAIDEGHAEQAAATMAELHGRLGKPEWMEAALIKAYVQAGDRESATALLDARLARNVSSCLGQLFGGLVDPDGLWWFVGDWLRS